MTGRILTDKDTGEEYEIVSVTSKDEAVIRPLPRPTQRWRAEMDKSYFYANHDGLVKPSTEIFTSVDNLRYELGNYFATPKQAEAAAEAIRACFTAIHADKSADYSEEGAELIGAVNAAHTAIYGDQEAKP